MDLSEVGPGPAEVTERARLNRHGNPADKQAISAPTQADNFALFHPPSSKSH